MPGAVAVPLGLVALAVTIPCEVVVAEDVDGVAVEGSPPEVSVCAETVVGVGTVGGVGVAPVAVPEVWGAPVNNGVPGFNNVALKPSPMLRLTGDVKLPVGAAVRVD